MLIFEQTDLIETYNRLKSGYNFIRELRTSSLFPLPRYVYFKVKVLFHVSLNTAILNVCHYWFRWNLAVGNSLFLVFFVPMFSVWSSLLMCKAGLKSLKT